MVYMKRVNYLCFIIACANDKRWASNDGRRTTNIHKYLMFHETHNIYDGSEGATHTLNGRAWISRCTMRCRWTTPSTHTHIHQLPQKIYATAISSAHSFVMEQKEKWHSYLFGCEVDWKYDFQSFGIRAKLDFYFDSEWCAFIPTTFWSSMVIW